MADNHQPNSVRISATYFLAKITVNKTLGTDNYIAKCLPKVKILC